MLADVCWCASPAALLGAASLYGGQLLDIRDVVQSPGVMLFAVSFSVVMAFMYAFVGLYRPNPIGLAACCAGPASRSSSGAASPISRCAWWRIVSVPSR